MKNQEGQVRLTYVDFLALRNSAAGVFNSYPIGARLPGMVRNLTFDEQCQLANYTSILNFLRDRGALNETAKDLYPEVVVETVIEPIDS